jgi:hypothetical protein
MAQGDLPNERVGVGVLQQGGKAVALRFGTTGFKDNQVRLQLFALAYNLVNLLRRLAAPKSTSHWTLTSLREELINIGVKMTRHSKCETFQLADVGVP